MSARGHTDAARAPRRSGSEKRQRGAPVSVRFLPDERARVDAKSRAAGLSLASYARASMLGDAGPRAKRAPTVNAELLAYAIAALNKVGANLNQIAHALNAGHAAGAKESAATLAQVRAAVRQILVATGRTDEP
jgi:hypothetical protein